MLYDIDIFSEFGAFTPSDEGGMWIEVEGMDDLVWVGLDEWGRLFWGDGFHPSAIGHELITENVMRAVTPEPATALLFGAGLMGIAAVSRKKHQTV